MALSSRCSIGASIPCFRISRKCKCNHRGLSAWLSIRSSNSTISRPTRRPYAVSDSNLVTIIRRSFSGNSLSDRRKRSILFISSRSRTLRPIFPSATIERTTGISFNASSHSSALRPACGSIVGRQILQVSAAHALNQRIANITRACSFNCGSPAHSQIVRQAHHTAPRCQQSLSCRMRGFSWPAASRKQKL